MDYNTEPIPLISRGLKGQINCVCTVVIPTTVLTALLATACIVDTSSLVLIQLLEHCNF